MLQAMVTGGEDGTIRHVLDRVNPVGVHVRAFKKPTEPELAPAEEGLEDVVID